MHLRPTQENPTRQGDPTEPIMTDSSHTPDTQGTAPLPIEVQKSPASSAPQTTPYVSRSGRRSVRPTYLDAYVV